MTNQDIETFFAVLDHGTMTAAAEALYITQPSLSARLKALDTLSDHVPGGRHHL